MIRLPELTGIFTKCKICNELKDDAHFKYQKGKRAGLVCRLCSNEQKLVKHCTEAERIKRNRSSLNYHHKNKKFITAKKKVYRENNIEKIKVKQKAYHKANAEIINAKTRKWHNENRTDHNLKMRNYYNKNSEKLKEYGKLNYLNNKTAFTERMRIWRETHPHAVTAYSKQYNLAKLNRTPKWADVKAIHKFYLDCPDGLNVDHIHPLQGKLVSGLHVLNNLQYLTRKANTSKSNKFYPYWIYYEQTRFKIETSGPEGSIFTINRRR